MMHISAHRGGEVLRNGWLQKNPEIPAVNWKKSCVTSWSLLRSHRCGLRSSKPLYIISLSSPACMHVLFSHAKHIVNLKCKSLPFFFFFFLPPITGPLMRCKICALMTEKLFRSGEELIGFNQGLHPSAYERQQTTSSWCLISRVFSRCNEGRARISLVYLKRKQSG